MKAVDKDFNKIAVTAPKASNQIRRFGDQAKQAESKVSGLTKSVRGFLTVAAVLGSAKFVFAKTAELETQTRSLQVLTGELETAQKIVGQLQKFASVTPFTSSELIESAKRLKAFGVDTEKLVDTTQRLADVSGATGARLNEVATAYGQIQAKGRLQGEELLQLQERGIALQDELQKMYGLTGEEFSDALRKGKFSAEAVEVALQRLTTVGGKYADGAISQSDTLAGRLSTLQDNIQRLATNVGTILEPLFKWVINSSIEAINYINQLAAQAARIQGFGISDQQRDSYWKQAGEEAEELIRLRGQLDALGNPDSKAFTTLRNERFNDLLEGYGYENGKIEVEITPVLDKDFKAPELLGGGPKLGGGGSSSASKATKGLSDAEKELTKQLRVNEGLVRDINQAYESRRSAITTLEDEIRYLQNAVKYGEEYAQKFREIRRLVMEGVGFNEAFDLVTKRDGLLSQVEAASQLNSELTQTEKLLKGAFEIVSNSLVSGIQGLIDGTKEWKDILSDITGQLGQMFLQAGFSALGSGLKIPGFDGGGYTGNGSRSGGLDGKGGQLAMLHPQETVIDHTKGRDAMSRYGMGGIGSTGPIQINTGPVMQMDGKDYVSMDDFNAGIKFAVKEGAKQGAAGGYSKTMSSLKNNRSTRKNLGM